MKMTWLHNFFGLFFIPAASRAKSAQQLISTVLPFHPLYFPWEGVKNPANSGDDSNLCEIHNNLVAQCACFGSIVQPELYIFSLRNSTTTTSTTTICFFFILHYLRMCYQISPAKPPPNEITEIRVDVMTKKSSSYFSLWPPFWAINKLWFVFNKYYRTWAIVSRSLYNFNPIFKLQSNLFSGLFFL